MTLPNPNLGAITTNNGYNYTLQLDANFLALAGHFAGATDPSTYTPSQAFVGMYWADTGNSLLKQRSNVNTWINKGTIGSDGTITWNSPPSSGLPLSGGSMTGAINENLVTLASASTVNIGAASGNVITISGTTTITAFDTVQAGAIRTLRFSGILTLTHNATSLILPGQANITTSDGDSAQFVSLGSGNWVCTSYNPHITNLLSMWSQPSMKSALIPTGYTYDLFRADRNQTFNYLYVDCHDSSGVAQNPTSLVVNIYIGTSTTAVYTSAAITTASFTDTISLTISANDRVRVTVTNTTGLTGGVLVTPRMVNR